ncbi:hypothetical protein M8818_005490 [Zalaria obscura]|uniref:Uncharacterized protein n=1 Tax=Zalaria obscura TaxID=2024903 RepID=A0ACC3S9Z0_9PEZI
MRGLARVWPPALQGIWLPNRVGVIPRLVGGVAFGRGLRDPETRPRTLPRRLDAAQVTKARRTSKLSCEYLIRVECGYRQVRVLYLGQISVLGPMPRLFHAITASA